MPKYRITTLERHYLTWEVEADSEEAVWDDLENELEWVFVSEEEDDGEMQKVELITEPVTP